MVKMVVMDVVVVRAGILAVPADVVVVAVIWAAGVVHGGFLVEDFPVWLNCFPY